jgi:hypothetical protein
MVKTLGVKTPAKVPKRPETDSLLSDDMDFPLNDCPLGSLIADWKLLYY